VFTPGLTWGVVGRGNYPSRAGPRYSVAAEGLLGRAAQPAWLAAALQGQAIRLDDFSPDVTLPFRAHAAHDGKVSDPVRVETGPAGDFVAESQALGFTP